MHDDTTDSAAPSRNGKARRHVDQGIDIAPIGRVPAVRKRQRDVPKIKDAVTVDEYITRLLVDAPPLSPTRLDRLRLILYPGFAKLDAEAAVREGNDGPSE